MPSNDPDDLPGQQLSTVKSAGLEAKPQSVSIGGEGILYTGNFTYTVQDISPGMAAHGEKLAEIEAKSRVDVERIRAGAAVKVAEAQHVTPARIAERPTWGAIFVLGSLAASGLASGHPTIATAAVIALGGVATISKWLSRMKLKPPTE